MMHILYIFLFRKIFYSSLYFYAVLTVKRKLNNLFQDFLKIDYY